MSREKSGDTVSSIKETCQLYKRAILVWYHEVPQMILFTGLHGLMTACTPYFGLYFTARLLNELAGAKRREELAKWVIILLTVTTAASILKAAFCRIKEIYTSSWWISLRNIYGKKMMSMDFSTVDDAATYEKLAWIEESENFGGYGLLNVYWQYDRFLGDFFKLAGAVMLSVSLFSQKVPEASGRWAVLNHPFCMVLLLLCIIGTSMANSWLQKLILGRENQCIEKGNLGNRVFSFIYEFTFDRKRDLDARLYRQEKECVNWFCSFHSFDTKSWLAKDAKGMIGFWTALQTAAPNLLMGMIYLYVCLKSWAGAFGVGMITQYVGAVTAMSGAVTGIFTVIAMAQGNAYYLKKLFQFLDIPNKMYQGSLTVEKRRDRNYEIEFRDVSFRYPGAETYALRHVSLKFRIGKRLAVVGRNGSGKTTFIKLLCRLYDPSEGVILLNGIDIRKYNYHEYMSIFSVVFQDFQLLSLSLAQNVAAGETFDRGRIADCIQKAGLAEMARKLPKGLDTYIGKDFEEDGINVSGGEAQKLALARSLYRDAAFIILDEPTAALDPVAEYEVYLKFNEIVGDRTAVYISHRLSSCRFCDEIIVFHEGRMIQQGSHEALLMQQEGEYARLWHAQAQYYTE